MNEYICISKCFHDGILYEPGTIAKFHPKTFVPHHFVPVKVPEGDRLKVGSERKKAEIRAKEGKGRNPATEDKAKKEKAPENDVDTDETIKE